MEATAAHRAPDSVADGTCPRVWAWMTEKCRRRMNGCEGYITIEITQSKGEKEEGGPEKGETLLDARGVGSSRPRARSPFSLGHWAVRFCVFFTPKISHCLIRA